MTSTKRNLPILVISTMALATGLLGLTTAPGSAATSTSTQSEDLFGGGPGLRVHSTEPISLPAGPGTEGPGAPYPSLISVPYDARVVDVNVQVRLTHTAPDDLDLVLVGPAGQQALLMSDAGGGADLVSRTIFIDDEAADPLPDNGPVEFSSYRPTDYEADDDVFPQPAPPQPAPTSLTVFDGFDAAGTWQLFAVDDALVDIGSIESWALDFELRSAPYPSSLDVAALPPITDVDVVLDGFTSEYPADMDLLLVGPGGQQATLMSDAGERFDVSDLKLRFDDEAGSALPELTQLSSGSFRPTNFDNVDHFGPGAPGPNGNTSLGVFDGLSPNGQWQLFFVDDAEGDISRATGWSLEFTFVDTQSPSGSVNLAGGAATTASRSVSLSLSASDPAPSAGITDMRFSNDGATFSAFQPYAATAAWELTSGSGTKTVFAQFRDADGNQSAVASDTITLQEPGQATPEAAGQATPPPADTTGPRGVKLAPAAGAKGVKTSARVKTKASEALRTSSLTGQRVFLKAKGTTGRIKARLTYVASSHTIVLIPKHALVHRTTYRVTIAGVTDVAGNPWDQKPTKAGAQALRYGFTTG